MPLADFFERGSVWKTIQKRHPYDFLETYELLEHLYGYQKRYVNLGFWEDGPETDEAGYALVRFLVDKAGLRPGARLIDAGAGLGQAAVDLAAELELRRVTGININARQVRFADALKDAAGLGDVVEHICGDASAVVGELDRGRYDFAMAVECIGHFPDPERFLAGVAHALTDRGRLVFCLNTANAPPGALERLAMKLSYGFVPESAERWRDRLTEAGLDVVDTGDITQQVLVPAMTRSIDALARPFPGLSWPRRRLMREGCRSLLQAAAEGRLSYRFFVAERRPST